MIVDLDPAALDRAVGALVGLAVAHRAERAADVDEMEAMTKRELIEWADHWRYAFGRRGTKAEIIEDLLPYF